MKKGRKRLVLIVILLILALIVHYAWISFPIISGCNAKQMCTCVFVSGRDQKAIDTSDLGEFPLNVASSKVDLKDSSVTVVIVRLGLTLDRSFDENDFLKSILVCINNK